MIRKLLILGVLIFFFGCPYVLSQRASQILKESYSPPVIQESHRGLIFPEFYGNAKVPAGAENYKLRLTGVFIENGLEELADETREISKNLTGVVLTGVDLFNVATALEAIYARAGYVLVRVVLPQQTLVDGGVLKLKVVRGYISDIDLSALPNNVSRHIEPYLFHLLNDDKLTQKKIERFLLLSSDTPGFLMRTTLKRGDLPRTTTLIVSGRYDKFSIGLGANDRNSEVLGTYSIDIHSELNSHFGLGEAFYAYVGGHQDNVFSPTPRNRQVALGLTMPISARGSWINLERVESRANPRSNQLLSFRDTYQKTSLSIGHHWLRSRTINFNSSLTAKFIEDALSSVLGDIELPFSKDDLTVTELRNHVDFHSSFGYLSSRLTLSKGLKGKGDSRLDELPRSREGADPKFKKIQGDIYYQKFFASNVVGLKLYAKTQSALGGVLPASERLSIDGVNMLSAYTAGSLTGDSGYVSRADLSFPRAFNSILSTKSITAAPYLFFAQGKVQQQQPTALEAPTTSAEASGAGIVFSKLYPGKSHYVRLVFEYAYGTEKSSRLDQGLRLNLTAKF